jgi:putative molybdopterin biosynthesis protein
MILAHHHELGAADVPALVAAGVTHIEVLRLPRVSIIATGTELLDWTQIDGKPLAPGRIVETNSMFLAGLVKERGGEPEVLDRRPDEPGAIMGAVREALDGGAHMVLVNAGASAGSHDYTAHVLKELGEVLVHGIRAMPGKPTILARVGQRPVVGTPGYPVSAWVCFDQFVGPAIDQMRGQQPRARETMQVVPARKLASKPGLEEFVRVHLGRVGEHVVATPLKRGAGTISSLTRADGIIRIPASSEGIDEGRTVVAELLRPRAVVERTLVIVGSHDVTIDLMADHIREIAPEIHVSASNVGSLAGLIALRDGRSHLGGTHLLDPGSGEYNVSWVRRHVSGMPVRLVTLAHREQGLIVPAGNPDGIRDLSDLTREKMSFVNRQAGAGTRVLFDYHLESCSIDPASINGYDHEEFTHMAVNSS